MSKITFQVSVDTTTGEISVVNVETGEVKEVKAKKTTSKKKKEEESSEPQLILEDNKYCLNTAAVELLGVEPDDRLCIKYKKIGKAAVPVIGTEEVFKTKGGNKLTKTNTVSCRGKANEELATYGTVFTLSENPDGSGTFILTGDKAPETPVVHDEAVDTEDEDIRKDLEEIGDSISTDSEEPVDEEEVDSDELDDILKDL
jgi:hypothetical protein